MPACANSNTFIGDLPLRISSIFVILLGSALGASFPVIASRCKSIQSAPAWTKWLSFVARHVGTGVILGTAVIHLLAPAHQALQDPCLPAGFHEYTWTEGIMLTSMFGVCFVEVLSLRYSKGDSAHSHGHQELVSPANPENLSGTSSIQDKEATTSCSAAASIPRDSSLENGTTDAAASSSDSYTAQVTSIFILEFGVVFHSAFVGLALAVSGSNFKTLYAALTFHQTLEGVALGSRVAAIPWPTTPRSKRCTPWLLVALFSLSTSISIAVGLAVRAQLNPGSQMGLIVSGVFYSVSAGILIWTGLVELLAREFIYEEALRNAAVREFGVAFGAACLGAALMAVVGKWT